VAGRGTAFLDHDELLGSMPEPGWFEANIPFVDLPDDEIEEIYYYRWKTYQESLKNTGEEGWISTEFLGPVGYSAPSGGIVAAAGHHVYEGRWLRDTRYLDDLLRYWLRGSGAGPKPATDFLNENTTDWAHQYSSWLGDAAVARASVTGDWAFATDLLPELRRHWERWAPQYDAALGLYWQTPVWDAMEYTAGSYASDDPYHGGEGFRPTLNTYQIADALAIAELASRTGDTELARTYRSRAAALRGAQDALLWDGGFYKHVARDGNPDLLPLPDREQIGFTPWAFGAGSPEHVGAWAQFTDPQGFDAPYGPTTVERRSPWFMHEAHDGCCRWDGPSWPYATSLTLMGLANVLTGPAQSVVDVDDYVTALRRYALTQYRDGVPHVAEAHDPDRPVWLYDSPGHSEDYNHSTYADLVLSGLLGVRPQTGDSVLLHPLVPADWDHFALENLAYHGRELSVLWDRDGTRYGRGSGLSVYLDGRLVARQDSTAPLRVRVPARTPAALPRLADDAVNADGEGFPVASATYANTDGPPDDAPQRAIDGQNHFLDVPTTRWTTYRSPNATDSLTVDFGRTVTASDVRLYFYDDGGGVRVPASYRLQHRRADGSWADVPGTLPSARPNDLTRVTFPPLRTTALRLVGTPLPGSSFGLTAFQSWRPASSAARPASPEENT
jgi:hypothetical protein